MTAGRGIIHSETPASKGDNFGLQLWVNLASKEKMIEPAYQELKAKDIPVATADGVKVKVIAGKSLGVESPVYTRTPTMYLDVSLEAKAEFTQEIPEDFRGFAYILEGDGTFGSAGTAGKAHQMLLFGSGNSLKVVAGSSDAGVRFVIIAGRPIG
jgi:redox-sensitive bicupin YhaK (pirin superfamily)